MRQKTNNENNSQAEARPLQSNLS